MNGNKFRSTKWQIVVFRKTDVAHATFTGLQASKATLQHYRTQRSDRPSHDQTLRASARASGRTVVKSPTAAEAADARRLKRAPPLTLSITLSRWSRVERARFSVHVPKVRACVPPLEMQKPIRPWQIELKGQHAKWGRRGGRGGGGGVIFLFISKRRRHSPKWR